MNIHVSGFRGPWGWVNHYESYTRHNVTDPDEADVIFCCDHASWKHLTQYLGKKYIIANVLDLAEWRENNTENIEYVEKFCSKANLVTAISLKVIQQLRKQFSIEAEMFFYPSQVTRDMMDEFSKNPMPKKNSIISFCRLGDPGKRIRMAAEFFDRSGIAENGWSYYLVGPEGISLPKYRGVKQLSYFSDPTALYRLVSASKFTLVPSIGEGLGLPAIESLLVGTNVICRAIEPLIGLLYSSSVEFFFTDMELFDTLKSINDITTTVAYIMDYENMNIRNWERYTAFDRLDNLLSRSKDA
jgi:hypothetical protein